jgi:eukaryotic-like serine/threonine-protein kinase
MLGRRKISWVGLLATIAGVLVGIPGILAAAGVRNWVILTVAASAAALMSGTALAAQDRWRRRAARRDDLVLDVAQGSVADPDGRLYRVRDFPDPIRLGVHSSARKPGMKHDQTSDRVPPYVPRDVDEEIREHLASAGFVLITGDSTAGKSRTAYEAISSVAPGHFLLAPESRDSLQAALSRMTQERECVLWLDDLERFIGSGGLTRTGITRVLAGAGHHRLIIATLRSAEMARHAGHADEPDEMRRQLSREVRETLEQAHIVFISRMASNAERARAKMHANDPRVAEALAHAGTYGLAEYLAAGPELLRIWEAGWEPGGHPRGASLVRAAVDCRRAGLTKPAPRALLEDLHADYLEQRGGTRLRPESLDEAWTWVTTPRVATAVLLEPVRGGDYVVFDYLVDSIQRRMMADELIPTSTLERILSWADPAEAETIGWTAMTLGNTPIAFRAFSQSYEMLKANVGAEHRDTLSSRRGLAYALYSLGRWRDAESDLRAIVASCERALGPVHEQTLASRNDLAYVLCDLSENGEAESEFSFILAAPKVSDHLRLAAHEGLAATYNNTGRYIAAEAIFKRLISQTAALRGPDHIETLTRRCYRGHTLALMGRFTEAEKELRSALDAFIRTVGNEQFFSAQCRFNLGDLLYRKGELAAAEREYSIVADIWTRTLGISHPATTGCVADLAKVRTELNP